MHFRKPLGKAGAPKQTEHTTPCDPASHKALMSESNVASRVSMTSSKENTHTQLTEESINSKEKRL